MRILAGIFLGILFVILGGVAFIYSGIFNIAASDAHSAVVRWALHTAMHRSVAARTDQIKVPANYTHERIRRGASHVRHSCVICHSAPNAEPSDVSKGLNPDPPRLVKLASHRTDAELFWIVKHGIKMTGMPAFGASHDDQKLWDIVAFVSKLPEISPEESRELMEENH